MVTLIFMASIFKWAVFTRLLQNRNIELLLGPVSHCGSPFPSASSLSIVASSHIFFSCASAKKFQFRFNINYFLIPQYSLLFEDSGNEIYSAAVSECFSTLQPEGKSARCLPFVVRKYHNLYRKFIQNRVKISTTFRVATDCYNLMHIFRLIFSS